MGGAIGSRSTVAEGSPMTHSFFLVKKSLENQMETGQDFFLEDVCVFFFFGEFVGLTLGRNV